MELSEAFKQAEQIARDYRDTLSGTNKVKLDNELQKIIDSFSFKSDSFKKSN